MRDDDVIPGDWIIHSGPVRPGVGVSAMTQYSSMAVYVVDATPDHLVVYDPTMAETTILDRWMFQSWRHATPAMVESTWKHAMKFAGTPDWRLAPVTADEMERFPVKRA